MTIVVENSIFSYVHELRVYFVHEYVLVGGGICM